MVVSTYIKHLLKKATLAGWLAGWLASFPSYIHYYNLIPCLQTGHICLLYSHISAHLQWNTCLHPLSTLTSSPFLKSSKHTEQHVTFKGPTPLWISFGYNFFFGTLLRAASCSAAFSDSILSNQSPNAVKASSKNSPMPSQKMCSRSWNSRWLASVNLSQRSVKRTAALPRFGNFLLKMFQQRSRMLLLFVLATRRRRSTPIYERERMGRWVGEMGESGKVGIQMIIV